MPSLPAFFETLYNLGIQPNDSSERVKELRWHNRLAVLILLFLSFGCFLLYLVMPAQHIVPIQLAVLSKLLILFANYFRYNSYVHHLQSFTHLLIGFAIVGTFGKNMDLHYLFVMMILYIIVIRIATNLKGVGVLLVLTVFFFSWLFAIDSSFYDAEFISESKIPDFQNILVLLMVSLLSMISFQFVRTAQKNTQNLLKSEKLLHQKFKELGKTNQELDRFIYSVSHDLRAPLASALGLVDLSRKDTTNRQMYFDMQEKSLKKLDNFIQDILLYSQNVNLSPQIEAVDLHFIVNEIFESLKFEYYQMKVKLSAEIVQNNTFYTDKFRLQIILSNLIGNAIRYHNPKAAQPFVQVNINARAEFVKIEIQDNGIGIGKEHLPQIFNMFYRAHTQSIGSGLGLYIVNEAVTKLGGDIQVHSTLGQGSTFSLTLPNLNKQINKP